MHPTEEHLVPEGEEMALEGAKSGPCEDESLATLLMKEVRRRREENQELSPDHSHPPTENKEYDQKGEGEGVSEESRSSKASPEAGETENENRA